MAKANDKPIAVIGSGHAGMAALINKLIDIADTATDKTPPVDIVLIDLKEETKPKPNTAYPLNGKTVDQIHPFESAKPPLGFPTFGEYIRDMATSDPSLKSALRTPTYRQVNDYMQYVLELAVINVGEKAMLDVSKQTIESIEQKTKTGPATINFTDGDSLDVKEIVRATPPPHMGGPKQGAQSPKAAAAATSKPQGRKRVTATAGM